MFKSMAEKLGVKLDPTLADWIEYLNHSYRWCEEAPPGLHRVGFTPATIEGMLRATGFIVPKGDS